MSLLTSMRRIPVSFDHVGMIKSPNNWPRWPALPVKRMLTTEMQVGYLFGDPRPGKPIMIYKGNIWAISVKDPVLMEYQTAEEMVADGWKVD